jgi:NAD(P)-dependent dehydrogenase (short-subunit alcohol dehydrogenase family)
MTSVEGSVALVTSGSRGIGRALVAAQYERGAKKVYATARDPRSVTHPEAVPLALELSDPESAAGAAEQEQRAGRATAAPDGGAAARPELVGPVAQPVTQTDRREDLPGTLLVHAPPGEFAG